MNEKWSNKYKQSIDCDNPKGFSQKAHCAGKKKSFKEMREYVRGFGTYPGDTMKPMASLGGSQFFPNKKYATTMPALSATYKGPGFGTYKPMLSASKSELNKQHMQLLSKALRTMPGSQKQKEIKQQINVVRKKLGLKSIKEAEKRIPRKKGQPAGSDKHSDLYTDENPKGTIHGLGFTDKSKAKQSVSKIRNSGRTDAHKIQAAIAMSQRAKVASQRAKDPEKKKDLGQAHKVYQKYIDKNKKKD